jgi:hypothetical protein
LTENQQTLALETGIQNSGLGLILVSNFFDGLDKVAQHKEIFAGQREQLREGSSVVMFSETEHAHTYYLRPLSRGSARLALTTQQETEKEVQLVPVGINYYHLRRPGFKVSVVVGTPISVPVCTDRYQDDAAGAMNTLCDDLRDTMKACLRAPNETDNHQTRVDRIHRKNEGLPFPEMKRALQTPENLDAKGELRPGLLRLARGISRLNIVPMWGTRPHAVGRRAGLHRPRRLDDAPSHPPGSVRKSAPSARVTCVLQERLHLCAQDSRRCRKHRRGLERLTLARTLARRPTPP